MSEKVTLKTTVCGAEFDNVLMNASGCLCKTKEELFFLDESDSGGMVTKTCTYEPRIGNEEPRYWHNDVLSINSMGLPNDGLDSYLNMSNFVGKPYFLSVSAGCVNQDLLTIVQSTYRNIKGVEINVSCPNLIGKSQIDYNFNNFDEFLRNLYQEEYDVPIGLKLSPYFSNEQFEKAADIINDYPISFLTTVNGLGNGLVIDYETEKPVIKPNSGLGGIGGNIIKPIGLSNTYKMSKLTNCEIIGCGGITSGKDAFEYILAGASAVQIGTQLVREKYDVFSRINSELKEIMANKGYDTIYDFKGGIKI